MEKERLGFIDRAKGIGIISLILGHLFTYGSIPFSLIFAFHMPLFFLVSGVFFKPPQNIIERNAWVKKVLVRYITPYVFFSIFGFVATILMGKDINWSKAGHDFIYTIGIEEFNAASLWFLIVLAFTHIILMFLLQAHRKISHPLNVVMILLVFLYFSTKIHVRIPFLFLSYFSATLFVYIGYMYKDILFKFVKMSTTWVLGGAFLFVILSIVNRTVNIAAPCYNDVFIFFVTALLGCVFVFNVANSRIWDYFGRFDFLRFLGQNSLIAFCTHKIWIVVYLKLLYKITGLQFEAMVNLPYSYCLIGLLFVTMVIYPTIALINPLYNIVYVNICKLFRLK